MLMHVKIYMLHPNFHIVEVVIVFVVIPMERIQLFQYLVLVVPNVIYVSNNLIAVFIHVVIEDVKIELDVSKLHS